MPRTSFYAGRPHYHVCFTAITITLKLCCIQKISFSHDIVKWLSNWKQDCQRGTGRIKQVMCNIGQWASIDICCLSWSNEPRMVHTISSNNQTGVLMVNLGLISIEHFENNIPPTVVNCDKEELWKVYMRYDMWKTSWNSFQSWFTWRLRWIRFLVSNY